MTLFITFEGCEGSGKSTQIAMLSKYLQKFGKEVLTTREPGGTDFAEKIRALILSENGINDLMSETLLINAARRDHVNCKILPALKGGQIVICDRFFDSTLVYQGFVKGMDLSTLNLLNKIAIGKLVPDITFLMDVDPNQSLARIAHKRAGNNFYDLQPLDFHLKIRAGFLEIAADAPNRVIIINASGSISEIHANIIKNIEPLI